MFELFVLITFFTGLIFAGGQSEQAVWNAIGRALEATDGCDQAVTLKFDDRTLVSFVSPGHVCPIEARDRVEQSLPYYCCPKVVLPMDQLPKTTRGKLDKRLLLDMAAQALADVASEAAE